MGTQGVVHGDLGNGARRYYEWGMGAWRMGTQGLGMEIQGVGHGDIGSGALEQKELAWGHWDWCMGT